MAWYAVSDKVIQKVAHPLMRLEGAAPHSVIQACRLTIHPSLWYLRPERRNAKIPGLLDISILCFSLFLAWRAK